jgi:hypothetical protein
MVLEAAGFGVAALALLSPHKHLGRYLRLRGKFASSKHVCQSKHPSVFVKANTQACLSKYSKHTSVFVKANTQACLSKQRQSKHPSVPV